MIWSRGSESNRLNLALQAMSGTISEILVYWNYDFPRLSVNVDAVNNYLKAKYGL